MPVTKSAKKALRKSLKNRAHNLIYKNKIKFIQKQIQKAIMNKNKNDMIKKLREFYKIVDKAAKKNVIKKNKAAKLKSRLAKMVNRGQ